MPQKKKEPELSEYEIEIDNIMEALCEAKDINEAAEIAGVSRKRIYEIVQFQDHAVTRYRNLMRIQFRDISNKMTDGAEKAAEKLISMLDDEELPPNVKLQVCTKIIELYAKFRDLEGNINSSIYREKQDIMDFEPIKSGL